MPTTAYMPSMILASPSAHWKKPFASGQSGLGSRSNASLNGKTIHSRCNRHRRSEGANGDSEKAGWQPSRIAEIFAGCPPRCHPAYGICDGLSASGTEGARHARRTWSHRASGLEGKGHASTDSRRPTQGNAGGVCDRARHSPMSRHCQTPRCLSINCATASA